MEIPTNLCSIYKVRLQVFLLCAAQYNGYSFIWQENKNVPYKLKIGKELFVC